MQQPHDRIHVLWASGNRSEVMTVFPRPLLRRCFADTAARPEVGARDCQILVNFAELVTRELEKDILLALHEAKGREQAQESNPYHTMLRRVDHFEAAMLLVDTSKDGWPLVHANTAWAKLAGERIEGWTLLRASGWP